MGRILIVDDLPASRDAMSRLLQHKGYETVVAANGEEGIMKLRQSNPDLVLLDHMMPKVDGLTFLAQIRRFPKWKQLPVIMMTGIKDRSHHMKAAALGVSEYVVKTEVTPPDLLEHVLRLVPIGVPPAVAAPVVAAGPAR